MPRRRKRDRNAVGGRRAEGGAGDGVANFDLIARSYRFLEYMSFGPLLQRTRAEFVGRLRDRRVALVLGDGDGRFVAALLAANRVVAVHAVDTSRVMLSLLARRASALTVSGDPRASPGCLETYCESALAYTPDFEPDLIATHFFLDCLRQAEVDRLVRRLAARMAPGGMWLVSEFHIPEGWLRGPARLYVRMLYFAFRLVTELRTTCLPEYAPVFVEAGLRRVACRRRLFGLLTSELWQKVGAPGDGL